MQKSTFSQRTDVTILTLNVYLKHALTSLVAECSGPDNDIHPAHQKESFVKDASVFKVALIDVEYIYTQRDAWFKIYKSIISADYYAFISLTDLNFCRLPSLSVRGPVSKIKKSLLQFVKNPRQKKHELTRNNPLSSLSYSEKEIFFFLISGYSINDIFLCLGKSRKTIYQSRTSLMKKMKLGNKKDLHMMLKLCEFIEYYTFKESTRATGDSAYVVKNKTLPLFAHAVENKMY